MELMPYNRGSHGRRAGRGSIFPISASPISASPIPASSHPRVPASSLMLLTVRFPVPYPTLASPRA
jgi:hypothetical protein